VARSLRTGQRRRPRADCEGRIARNARWATSDNRCYVRFRARFSREILPCGLCVAVSGEGRLGQSPTSGGVRACFRWDFVPAYAHRPTASCRRSKSASPASAARAVAATRLAT
jgi:hypothetical protein